MTAVLVSVFEVLELAHLMCSELVVLNTFFSLGS
jgi:hypothetical protein